MKNRFSIIIPTYKRRKNLVNLIYSLENKIPNGSEVIVVEQGENHEEDYQNAARKTGIRLKYFFLNEPNTSKAKNIGVINSIGDFIVFFDDDVLLNTDISRYVYNFENKKVAAVTGRTITKEQAIEANKKNTGKITFMGKFTDGYSSNYKQEIDTVIGCNVCWMKKIFIELGGFDEQFTGNAIREESDLSLKAKENGYKIIYDPSIEVFHVRAESGGTRKTEGRIKWYFDFFSNETYFFLKHRPLWVVPFIMITRFELAMRCMFGFGREVSLKSISTPFLGYLNGYKKYRRYTNENRG